MADRTDIVLVADGGDITVGRRAATYTYGTFQVTLPDGVDQVPTDDRLQDGYIYRPDNPPTGRFDVGFVRADASVDLQAQTSDVEEVIDLAQRRVEGDVFFERDITAAGLGQNVPGVDFDVGDIVTVELWSKQLPSPVTAWDQITDQSTGVTGDRVHVGGQLIADPVALRRQKNDLEQQIAAETRQRLRQVGQVDQTARSAKSTADTARGEVAAVRDTLAGEQSGEPDLVSQLVAVNNELQRLGQSPQPSLMLAFVSLSTALWQAQQEINTQQAEINAQQDLINRQTREIDEAQNRSIQLLSLYNHGALFIDSGWELKAKVWRVLDFKGVRGSLVGCEKTSVDGAGAIRFLSPGDWEVNLRVNIPPSFVLVGGTMTAIRVTLMPPGGGDRIGRARTNGYNSGWDETLNLRTTVTVPAEGSYLYAEAYSADNAGTLSAWPADIGPELTELSVRQLSIA